MHPTLFEIPFIHWPIHSFGVMMVIGFLLGYLLVRRLSRDITPDPQLITSAALYCLIAGVVGARTFYIVHHFSHFDGRVSSIFAIWQGGLEFYGGLVFAIPVLAVYLRHHRLAVRPYLDILAIGLMLGVVSGRLGCFLNGCCFGKPAQLPWAVRFPYGSYAYRSQIYWNPKRNRLQPQLTLPAEFSIYHDNENGIAPAHLKAYEQLTQQQKDMVKNGKYRCLPVHPAQLYSSANGGILCLLLYLFWRRSQKGASSGSTRRLFTGPGHTFALAFVLYGITRFFIESLRDDNPFEFDGLTISQIISIGLITAGPILMAIFQKINRKPSFSAQITESQEATKNHNGCRRRDTK